MKIEKFCFICDKSLGPYAHNKQIYCDEKCKREGRRVKDRIRKQKEKFHKLTKQRICKRCKSNFFEHTSNDIHYCKNCKDIVTEATYQSKGRLKKMQEPNHCLDCKAVIIKKRKRCTICAEIKKKEQIQEHHAKVSKEKEDIANTNKKKSSTIDPRFLVRNYSGNKLQSQGLCNSFNL